MKKETIILTFDKVKEGKKISREVFKGVDTRTRINKSKKTYSRKRDKNPNQRNDEGFFLLHYSAMATPTLLLRRSKAE